MANKLIQFTDGNDNVYVQTPKVHDIVNFTPAVGSNYDAYGGCFYYKLGKRVTVHIGVKDLTPNSSQTLGNLPAAYRPFMLITTCGVGGETYTATSWLQIDTFGNIKIVSEDHYACATITFDVLED